MNFHEWIKHPLTIVLVNALIASTVMLFLFRWAYLDAQKMFDAAIKECQEMQAMCRRLLK